MQQEDLSAIQKMNSFLFSAAILDLPKRENRTRGKAQTCPAIREVEEETACTGLKITGKITAHLAYLFPQKKEEILKKKPIGIEMEAEDCRHLIPQD